jgi:tricorn protease
MKTEMSVKNREWMGTVLVAARAVALLLIVIASVILLSSINIADMVTARPGYYRDPAIHGDTIIFTAEGDLWTVSAKGGAARRLTSNPGRERGAAISPDGRTVAFSAEYEGPVDVYTMPVEGGLPQRLTWDGDAAVAGWTPDGRVLVRTGRYSTLPDPQLVAIDSRGGRELVPLAQAAEASYTPDGHTLFFTRYNRQGSSTKRYKGGTAENIWRYDAGSEAVPLTADWPGTSHDPTFWDGRVYFLSDRDGVMNVYSVDRNGHGLKQHTHQHGFDVQWASLSDGRIAYQCGADLWLLDLRTGQDAIIAIRLVTDFDQLRDHWVGKACPRRTAAGWRIATRTSNCGCAIPRPSSRNGSRSRWSTTSRTSLGRPTASGWRMWKRPLILLPRSSC